MTTAQPFTAEEEAQVREMGTVAPCLGDRPAGTVETIQRLMLMVERYEATLTAVRASIPKSVGDGGGAAKVAA